MNKLYAPFQDCSPQEFSELEFGKLFGINTRIAFTEIVPYEKSGLFSYRFALPPSDPPIYAALDVGALEGVSFFRSGTREVTYSLSEMLDRPYSGDFGQLMNLLRSVDPKSFQENEGSSWRNGAVTVAVSGQQVFPFFDRGTQKVRAIHEMICGEISGDFALFAKGSRRLSRNQ